MQKSILVIFVSVFLFSACGIMVSDSNDWSGSENTSDAFETDHGNECEEYLKEWDSTPWEYVFKHCRDRNDFLSFADSKQVFHLDEICRGNIGTFSAALPNSINVEKLCSEEIMVTPKLKSEEYLQKVQEQKAKEIRTTRTTKRPNLVEKFLSTQIDIRECKAKLKNLEDHLEITHAPTFDLLMKNTLETCGNRSTWLEHAPSSVRSMLYAACILNKYTPVCKN